MNIEVQFKAADQDELEQKMASMLVRCGWSVTKSGAWLTPKQVAIKYKLVAQTLTMRLKRWEHNGHAFPARRSLTGRLRQMQVTNELHEWFMKLKQDQK